VHSTLDPNSRRVELSEERWGHITERHPELASHLEDVLRAVAKPDRRLDGPRPDEEWFYLAEAGPSRWLKVVVHYEQGAGQIVTAFARRSMP
jgi:hypothetical protein